MTTKQEEVSGKPLNLDTDIFPSRKIPSKCDTVGPSYLDPYPLAPHNCSEKKSDDLNASHSSTRNEKNTREKSFDHNQNLHTSRCVEKLTQHQTLQTLGQSSENSKCGNALHGKATFVTSNSTHSHKKSSKSGRNLGDESALVSPSIFREESHCEFDEGKCNKIGKNFRRLAQIQRTDTREKNLQSKSTFQRISEHSYKSTTSKVWEELQLQFSHQCTAENSHSRDTL